MTAGATDLVPIGLVRRAHGVRGEARVELYNEESDILLDLESVILRARDGASRRVTIVACRPAQGGFLVLFEGVLDKTAADALKGQQVLVARAELPAPDPGEFYHVDLVGLAVHAHDGAKIGEVVRVERTPGQDRLVVQGPGGERLVPLVDTFVRAIDLETKRIDLEPWQEEA